MRSADGLRIPVSAEVFPIIRGNQHSQVCYLYLEASWCLFLLF